MACVVCEGKRGLCVCPKCRAAACRTCLETWVLVHPLEVRCMACKEVWGPATTDALLTRTFRQGAWLKARVQTLMNAERALLPHTQDAAAQEWERRRIAADQQTVDAFFAAVRWPQVDALATLSPCPAATLLKHVSEGRTDTAWLRTLLEPCVAARKYALDLHRAYMRANDGYTHAAAPAETAAAFRAARDALVGARAVLDVDPRFAALKAAMQLGVVSVSLLHAFARDAAACEDVSDALGAVTQDMVAAANDARTRIRLAPPPSQPPPPPATPAAPAPTAAPPSTKYVCKCPRSDCRGSVAAATWTCAMCKTAVCAECEDVCVAPHACDSNLLQTITALRAAAAARDVCKCPRCFQYIAKTEGCNQMWCTQCHTPFDYATGSAIAGAFHNPEHSDWLRARRAGGARQVAPYQDGDDDNGACDADFWGRDEVLERVCDVLRTLQQRGQADAPLVAELLAAARCCTDARALLPPTRTTAYDNDTYKPLRVAYLLGALDDAAWFQALLSAEKTRERQQHRRDVLQVLLLVGAEVFGHILATHVVNGPTVLQSLRGVRDYVNAQFQQLKERFGGTSMHVDATWCIQKKST